MLRCAQSPRSNVRTKYASARLFFTRLASEIFLSSLQSGFFGDLLDVQQNQFDKIDRAKTPSTQRPRPSHLLFDFRPWRLCAFARVYSFPNPDLSPAKSPRREVWKKPFQMLFPVLPWRSLCLCTNQSSLRTKSSNYKWIKLKRPPILSGAFLWRYHAKFTILVLYFLLPRRRLTWWVSWIIEFGGIFPPACV
jgi:hypothetical protein